MLQHHPGLNKAGLMTSRPRIVSSALINSIMNLWRNCSLFICTPDGILNFTVIPFFLLATTSPGGILRISGAFSDFAAELGNLVGDVVSRFVTACWCD